MSWQSFNSNLGGTVGQITSMFESVSTGITNTSEAVKDFELPVVKTESTFSLSPQSIIMLVLGAFALIFIIKRK